MGNREQQKLKVSRDYRTMKKKRKKERQTDTEMGEVFPGFKGFQISNRKPFRQTTHC